MAVTPVGSLVQFTTSQTNAVADLNANLAAIRNAVNALVTASNTLITGLIIPSPTITGTLTITGVTVVNTNTLTFPTTTDTIVGRATTDTLTNKTLTSPTLGGTIAGAPAWTSGQPITLTTAAQPNVTSLGTLTSLTVTGLITANLGITVSGAPLLFTADNTWDIGATGATRPRDLWLGRNATITGLLTSGVGTATVTAKPTQVLYQNNTLSTGTTSDVSLASFSVPANVLAVNSQALRITITGQAVGQTATLNTKFGATALTTGATVAAGDVYELVITVARVTASTQVATSRMVTTTVAGSKVIRSTPGETLSGAVLLDFRGNAGAGGGGTWAVDSIQVEYLAS